MTPNNATRAASVSAALEDYADANGGDMDTAVRDFLADLRHYCDANEIDFSNEDRIAHDNYIAELEDEM